MQFLSHTKEFPNQKKCYPLPVIEGGGEAQKTFFKCRFWVFRYFSPLQATVIYNVIEMFKLKL